MGQYGGNFWPYFDLPTVVRKSAFSLKALGQLFSKQPKITCHIVIKSSWGQTLANFPAVFLLYFHCGFVMKYKDHNEQYKSAE